MRLAGIEFSEQGHTKGARWLFASELFESFLPLHNFRTAPLHTLRAERALRDFG